MKKGILLVFALGLLVFCATEDGLAQGAPKIEQIWASPEVAYGQILRVYIKASDPEGDMKLVQVNAKWGEKDVTAQSANSVASATIRLGKEWRKNLNGYLYFDTKQAFQKNIADGIIEVVIEDSQGNESMPMSVPVKILQKGAKAEKAPAEFKDLAIGPITAVPHAITP